MTTGSHAECYANEFVGGHLRDTERAWKGLSYADLGGLQGGLRTQIAEAKANDDPNLAALEEELTTVTDARDTVFKSTMLRNSLLTAYGFSVLGERAAQAATVIFIAGGIMTLLSIAGFAHALVTPKDEALAPLGSKKRDAGRKEFARV